ncbi:hypothetical protein [Lysinibacillus piscis]|uniref:Uncharacterized protein n=1 Tax=Lysinibacillus piscis TaxID=2518931 RepID=A0ABQ5NPY5_9BACI|nr:hypothetical protein [Lysinibacillus sp. KH24]GLC90171.1 hypothetical protein LYSBPC_32980 [Lysinibacillus sp. KH24]
MAWTFSLRITNDTDRDLEVVESQLHWGYWNTDGEEDKGPQPIRAGETIQAVGVKSAFGTNGYEFSCSWKDNNQNSEGIMQAPYGVVSLYVNVPYNNPNEATCQTNGYFEVDGWNDITHDGHNFIQNIRISNKMDRLRKKEHINSLYTDWSQVEALTALENVKNVDLNKHIPSGVHFEKMELFRTSVFTISKKLWAGVNDLDFNSLYLKQREVQDYFSVEVTCLRADATKIETVTKGGQITVIDEYALSTASKVVEEKVSTFESALKFTNKSSASMTKAKIATVGIEKELQIELKAKFNILNNVTNEQQQSEKKSTTRQFNAPEDKDMDVVPWIFSKMILLYRTDKNNVTTLIGASEWDYAILNRTHVYDVMGNAKQIVTTGGEQ